MNEFDVSFLEKNGSLKYVEESTELNRQEMTTWSSVIRENSPALNFIVIRSEVSVMTLS
jgi:hypothetical protein